MVGNTGRIIVELPGVNDIKRVRGLLQGSANLEIWDTWYLKDFPSQAINTEVKLMLAAEEAKDTTLNDVVLETAEDTARAEFLKEYPFTGLFVSPGQNGEGCILGSAFEKDTSKIMTYIRLAQFYHVIFFWIVPI
jgi:SecD/SecF fusion protein